MGEETRWGSLCHLSPAQLDLEDFLFLPYSFLFVICLEPEVSSPELNAHSRNCAITPL